MSYFVYILRSLKDGKLYVGISTDPLKRLHQHNAGKTFSTRSRRPFELIYTQKQDSRQAARNREKFLKSYAGAEEKQLILKNHIGE